MTHHSIYSLKGTTAAQRDLTLYEACRALKVARNAGLIHDGTHVNCNGRFVAFFSEWDKTIHPMFQANDSEREIITMWMNPINND